MARREITNWSQLQRFQPREIFTPRSEDELAAIVARAGVEGRRIKVMGAGHSFTAIAVTPDFHVTIHALDQLHHVDQSSGVVTVGAGIQTAAPPTQVATATQTPAAAPAATAVSAQPTFTG